MWTCRPSESESVWESSEGRPAVQREPQGRRELLDARYEGESALPAAKVGKLVTQEGRLGVF